MTIKRQIFTDMVCFDDEVLCTNPGQFSAGLGKTRYIQSMNTQKFKFRFALYGLPLALVLLSATAFPHELIGADGEPTHQHVYKNGGYGNTEIVGHAAKPAGSRGIVIWDAAPSQRNLNPPSGMRIPKNPFSKNDPQRDAKNMYKQKPAFSKDQDRTPEVKPQ